jgi:hypothetical protein
MGTVKENLIAARALIDTPEKWVQGAFEDGGGLCAIGACGVVTTGDPQNWQPAERAALLAFVPAEVGSVMLYNDADTTTHADIMALFDRAIAAQDAPDLNALGEMT